MNFDRIIDNRTPMAVRCLPSEDRAGRPTVVIVAKLTWFVSPIGEASIAVPQREVRLADEATPGGGPMASIRYPSDLVDEKPGTDVVFVGTAYPPVTGRATSERIVSLRVGPLHKALRVFGPRVFQAAALGGIAPGPAAQLAPTPLVYELAHGGYDDGDPNRLVMDPANPAGIGVCRTPAALLGRRAPQIELASDGLGGRPCPPAGFGAIGPHWSPRRELAGTYDAAWRRDRAPLRPLDFDPRHAACAHPDLHSPAPLHGGEPVEVLGATPEGVWRFRLPPFAPTFRSRRLERDLATGRLESRGFEHATHLDTFLVDGDAGLVELTWRASLRMPRKIDHLESVTVFGAQELPPATFVDLVRRTPSSEAESVP